MRSALELIMETRVSDWLMFGVLLILFLGVGVSLYRAHKANGGSKYNNFNLIDLVATRDGKVDRPAFLEMSTFALIGWGFIVLVTKQQWGLLVAYGGMMCGVFVARAAHAAYLKSNQQKDAPNGDSKG